MEFVNKTKNTVSLGDINLTIPYQDERAQYIDLDLVKKSKDFQFMVRTGNFKILSAGDSPFEKALMQRQYVTSYKNAYKEKKEILKNTNNIEVKICGQFYEAGGYAKVNRNLAIGLNSLGCDVNISPLNKINNLPEEEIREIKKINKNVSKNAIVIDSMIPTIGNMSSGRYNILYTTVEAYSIPQQFVEIANSYNEIWATSDFCKEILQKHNVQRPIFVIPDSINTDIYKEEGDKFLFNPPLKKFIFLSIFGWNYRKGYDVLLKSYLEEFNSEDNVSLLIVSRCSFNPAKNVEIKETIKKYVQKYKKENTPHISCCTSVIPEESMPDLYRACNAFVLLSRGESFGLPFAESSLCGLPVISTNVSGQTMFLNKNNSYLVELDKISPLPEGLMGIHYWDNQLFPELKSDNVIRDAKKCMRDVYSDYNDAKQKNKLLSKFIKENYNIENISKIAHDRLKRIWENFK